MTSTVKNVAGAAFDGIGAAASKVVEWGGHLVSLIVSGAKQTLPLAQKGIGAIASLVKTVALSIFGGGKYVAVGAFNLSRSAVGYVPVAFNAVKESVKAHPVAYGVACGVLVLAAVGIGVTGATGAAGYYAYNKFVASKNDGSSGPSDAGNGAGTPPDVEE